MMLALVGLAVSNLRRSTIGKMLLAVRGNERAAAAMGINVTVAKLYAFVVSGVIAGIAGILAAWEVPNVLLNIGYDPFQSVNAVVSATLTGVGYISGGILGGALTTPGGIAGQLVTKIGFGQYLAMVTGGLLLVNIVFNPNGMVPNAVGAARAGWRKVSHRMEALSRRLTGWVPDGSRRGRFAGAGQLIGAVSDSDRDDAARTGRDEIPDRSAILLQIRDPTAVFGATEPVPRLRLTSRPTQALVI